MNRFRPKRARITRLLISAVVLMTLVVASTNFAVSFMLLAVGVRAALWMSQRLAAIFQQRERGRQETQPHMITLGADLRTGAKVAVSERALAAHGLVLGASGTGKTTTMTKMLSVQIARGRPVVVIDLKGSPALARELAACSLAAGRNLRIWTLDGGSWWNPFAYGNATELKDKIISTERFTEPHYKRAAERYLQLAIQVLQTVAPERPVTLSAVVRMLEPERLAAAATRLPAERADHIRDYVRSMSPDQLSAVRGLASRLALVSESHTGRLLEPSSAMPQLDLRRALDGGEVALFSLNSSTYGQLAGQIGTLAIQDLITAAGQRLTSGGAGVQATVAIDEFVLSSDNVLALLVRGRESGVGVILATQELSDLDRAARGLREQILGNTAVKIAHRQDVPESAEAVARLAGSAKSWQSTFSQHQGRFGSRASYGTSMRQVDKPIVEAEVIRSLATGQAVVVSKVPAAETHVTSIQRGPRGEREIGR